MKLYFTLPVGIGLGWAVEGTPESDAALHPVQTTIRPRFDRSKPDSVEKRGGPGRLDAREPLVRTRWVASLGGGALRSPASASAG
jgi:hypothetical protein